MLTTLTLAAVMLAAPVPQDTAPAGLAPDILELVADTDGKVRVTVVRETKRSVNVAVAGGAQPATREITSRRSMRVELTEVKDLVGYTADGKEIVKADLLKKIGSGGVTVVVSTDGKKVDPKFLKLFRDDVVVLVSPEFSTRTTSGFRTTLPGGGIQIQPLPAQIAPGNIQIQVLPVPVEDKPAVPEKKVEEKK